MYLLILWGILTLILSSLSYFIYTLIRDAKYFRDRGVYYQGNGILRLIYIIYTGIQMTDNLVLTYEEIKAKKVRFSGGMEFGRPAFCIVDLDLAKKILVKDFDHFVDRRSLGDSNNNKIINKMLLAQEGEKWKALRSKMSPTFTTGKIRRMFAILEESGQKMVKYLEAEITKQPGGVVDMQEAYSKYTMDVIASAAFGLDSKAFEQREPSKFEDMANKLQLKFSPLVIIKSLIFLMSPKIADKLGISLMQPESMDFFTGVIKSAIKYRGETVEKRDDFLQLMLEARAGQLKSDGEAGLNQFEKEAKIVTKGQGGQDYEVSGKVQVDLEDDDIVAQSVLFILGGFDTTQSLLLFSALNLALYPEIQERLYQEVKKSVEENDGKMTYDSINQMEYMEMFISETLRLYPPGVFLERKCTKEYKVPNSDLVINKGTMIGFPVFAIQRDPDHFPDPLKFDPERFSLENRSKIHPCAYMPFGYGPRNCIAMRLALMEAKMALAHLVLNFVFEPSAKTQIPVKFAKSGSLKPDGGTWLKLTSRK